MSNGMNKVTLFGNLGVDPELRRTPSGASVLKVRLATNRSWINRDGVREEDTQWHNVAVFGNRGEGLARVLRKGSYLLVEGRLHTSSYEKDGSRRYYTEIHAENVILGGRGGRQPDPVDDQGIDADGRAAADAWADAHVRPSAARSQPSDRPDAEAQMTLEERPVTAEQPDGTGAVEHSDSEALEPPASEPKPRRRDGGSGAPEATLPPPRRKTRSPGGAPAVAA